MRRSPPIVFPFAVPRLLEASRERGTDGVNLWAPLSASALYLGKDEPIAEEESLQILAFFHHVGVVVRALGETLAESCKGGAEALGHLWESRRGVVYRIPLEFVPPIHVEKRARQRVIIVMGFGLGGS